MMKQDMMGRLYEQALVVAHSHGHATLRAHLAAITPVGCVLADEPWSINQQLLAKEEGRER